MLYLFSMKKKSQISNLVTKTDLEDALKKYTTKTDLRNVEKSLRQEILKVEVRTERVEEKVDILDKKLYRLESKVDGIDERTKEMSKTLGDLKNTLDGFVGGVDLLKKENSVGADHTRELRVQVDDHEARLTTLESQ